MKAELKLLYSTDVAALSAFSPVDPTDFSILVRAMVGPVGDDSQESFDIIVCSPAWIAKQLERVTVFSPRHHLVMADFDYRALEVYITEFCSSCEGANWEEVGTKVSRLGRWEFEDYAEYEGHRD